MNPTLSDNILICGYFLIWIVTFVVYHWKFHNVDAGTTIIGSYFLYAFFSIITLNNPIFFLDYYDFKPLTLFPFIYLYIMLMIALSPTIYHHYHPVDKLVPLNTKLLYILSVALIISAVVMLPEVLMNFQDGIIKLITDTDIRSNWRRPLILVELQQMFYQYSLMHVLKSQFLCGFIS